VIKLTNFGAFVELEPDLEGLLHISELADHKISNPREVVKEGDGIEVKILKVDTEARKIGLSLRRAQWAAEEQTAVPAEQQDRAEAAAESQQTSGLDRAEAAEPPPQQKQPDSENTDNN
jgi:small subunit ribosomal protein S1